MKRIFIKNFKSIYNEIYLDLDNKNTIAIIGKNGIGKTNILLAIKWFLDKDMIKENIRSKNSNSITPQNPSEIILVTDILEEQKNKIMSLFETNSNKWRMNLKRKEFDDFFNVITKTDDKISKNINKDFISEEGKLYKSIYKFLIDKFIKTGIQLLNDAGNQTFQKYFLKGKDNNYIGLNWEEFEFIEDILERRKNGENITLEPALAEELKVLINIKDDLDELEKILDVNNIFNIKFIENANEESKTKVNYSLTTLNNNEQEDVTDLIDFLNNEFEFGKAIKDISAMEKSDEMDESDQEDLSLKISKLYDNINNNANIGVKKLFNHFDIYALPKFTFAKNSLIISVEDKNKIEITEQKTELNSSGYKAFFHFILKLKSTEYKAKKNPNVHFLILADEPDKNLHISLQRQLNEFYNQITNNNKNITLIFTTHSPYLINPEKNSIYIVDKIFNQNQNKKTGSTFITKYIKDLSKMEKIDSLNLLPIFEATRILGLNTGTNDLNSYFEDLVKNTRVVYLDPDLDYEDNYLSNFTEMMKNSDHINLKKIKLKSDFKSFNDVIVLTEKEIKEMHFNDYAKYIELIEKENKRLYITK